MHEYLGDSITGEDEFFDAREQLESSRKMSLIEETLATDIETTKATKREEEETEEVKEEMKEVTE